MIPIDTIVVPQGAEYQAVCQGLKKARVDRLQVISIPIGTTKIEQTLANYSDELNNAQNILIMGMCGSLSRQYTVGNTVVYQNCLNMAGEQVSLKSELTTSIQQKLSVELVRGITCDRIICLASEKLKLSQVYPVSVVDMEGVGYIKQLQHQKKSVAMVRVISDNLRGDIPNLGVAIDANGNLKTLPMAIAFVRQPAAAIRLISGSLTALKTLRNTTQQLFSV